MRVLFFLRPTFFLTAVLFSLTFLSPRPSLASWVVGSDGSLSSKPDGTVLSEGTKSSGEGSGDSETKGDGQSGSGGGSGPAPVSTTTSAPEPGKAESSPENKTGTKVEVKEKKAKVEAPTGGARVKIENEDGQFKLKVEDEAGREIEKVKPEGEDLLKIDERDDDNEIHIASESAEGLSVSHRRITARTTLPISVNLKTNQLVVASQFGSRVVAVLPDQAVQNLLRNRLLDQVGAFSVEEVVGQATPASALAQSIELKVDPAGQPIYEVRGFKKLNVLGFLPLSLPRTAFISAQTGAVEKITESALTRLVSLISL